MKWAEFFKALGIWIEDILVNLYHDPIETKPQELSMNSPDEVIVPMNTQPSHPQSLNLLPQLALAIRDYEGAPGDRNYRNNNPGNCRYSSIGYLPIYRPVGKDAQNFAKFKDMDTGMLYLHNLIKYKVAKNPSQTLLQFMQGYAPVADGNDPQKYAAFIGQRLSVPITALMQFIV